MTKQSDVDELIREALRAEGVEGLEALGEPGLPDMVTEVFRGRNRWIGAMMTANLLAVTIFALVCAVKFLGTDSPVLMARWGAGFFFCVIVAVGCKLWYWMQLDRLALSREIKRVELAIAQLAAELRERR
jgi:hypothetical protein